MDQRQYRSPSIAIEPKRPAFGRGLCLVPQELPLLWEFRSIEPKHCFAYRALAVCRGRTYPGHEWSGLECYGFGGIPCGYGSENRTLYLGFSLPHAERSVQSPNRPQRPPPRYVFGLHSDADRPRNEGFQPAGSGRNRYAAFG